MKKPLTLSAAVFFVGLAAWPACSNPAAPSGLTPAAAAARVESPEKTYRIELFLGAEGRPSYRVMWKGRAVVLESGLGFRLGGGEDRTRGFDKVDVEDRSESDTVWKPVWGERSEIRDRYRSATVRFRRSGSGDGFDVEVRAYEEGVAFRYVFPRGGAGERIEIAAEETEFRFAADHPLWAVYSAQGKYAKVPISRLRAPVERPCVLEPESGGVVAVAEAAQIDYARMRLRRSKEKPNTLVSALHGPVRGTILFVSPWRVIMAAEKPGRLLEANHLLLNLNEPCAIADTSWIRPGKVIREVTLSTEGGKACVDFAVRYGLQFVEYDAGWYGDERSDDSDARTVSRRGLDLHAVIRYARGRGIGIILYVNRRELERRLDELLPLYASWGVSGMKFGFVQHGSQRWSKWLYDAVRKAAAHRIMVDVHDEYRPTGWQRTYPNFMTAEGIGGDETRPPNEQALANLFTRMIAAPADHTFCYYNGYVGSVTSHASQLAKTVCFFSPWQFLFWYDRPSAARDEPELKFFRRLPVTWDETKVLEGAIGRYAILARRSGSDWYLGFLNAGERRRFEVPLSFLREGREYEARIYRDDPNAPTRTKVGIERRVVEAGSKVLLEAGERGGAAVRITPLDGKRRR